MKFLFIVLALMLPIAPGHRHQTEQSKPASSDADSGLPAGYRQTAASVGGDSATGRIWKENGPQIAYDIGPTAGAQAREFARQNPKATLTVTRSAATGEMVVALDEGQHTVVVSIDGRAHFTARNVRSQKDVIETILIANYVAGFSR